MEVNETLKDIIVTTGNKNQKGRTSTIFNTYVRKDEIGKNLYKSFVSYGVSNKDKIFLLSDVNKDKGLISISQGLISFSLIKQFTSSSYEKEESINEEERLIFNKNLEAFFKEIGYYDLKEGFKYNATPYVKEFTFDYVDSIAKCVQAILETRELILSSIEKNNPLKLYVEGIGTDNDILNALVVVLKDCLKKLVELKINCTPFKVTIGQSDTFEVSTSGWNYTNDSSIQINTLSSSLYFTYSVCLAYMSIYENIKDALDWSRIEDEEEKNNFKVDDIAKFERDKTFYLQIINEYNAFKEAVRSCGLYLDNKINVLDLRTKFLGFDFNEIDVDEIKGSTTNNAIFNTLFSVVILIASGVSDIYDSYFKERRYFEWLQSIMQNVYDTYCDLAYSQKGYIIDQYILNFNETIPFELYEQVNFLRKQRIQVLTVVPLMVRAYNMVSSWVIQYPQKQMINYLELIMTSRFRKRSGSYEWIWDRDGYDVNINSIYISALYDFYSYYEQYELPSISDKRTVESEVKKTQNESEAKFKRLKNEKEKEINLLNNKIDELIKKANQKNEEYKSNIENLPIVSAIKDLILEVLKSQLITILPEVFEKVTAYLCSRDATEEYSIFNEQDKNKQNDFVYKKESHFASMLMKLLTAYFSNELYSTINKEFVDKNSIIEDKKNAKLHLNQRYLEKVDDLMLELGNIISRLKNLQE